jgi:hypothetical protein
LPADPAIVKRDLGEWIRRLYAARDPSLSVTAQPKKETMVIGRDQFGFSVTASEAGHVYVLLAETDGKHLSLLFPNAGDRNNQIQPGRPLQLPRKEWAIDASGPPGIDRVLVMVSRNPREFNSAGLVQGEFFSRFDLDRAADAVGRVANGAPALAGTVTCPPQAPRCDAGYGGAYFEVNEIPQ